MAVESEAGGVKPVRKVLEPGSAVRVGACPVALQKGERRQKKKGVRPQQDGEGPGGGPSATVRHNNRWAIAAEIFMKTRARTDRESYRRYHPREGTQHLPAAQVAPDP